MDIEKLVAVALREKAVVLIAQDMVKFIPSAEKEQKAPAKAPEKPAPKAPAKKRKELDMGKVRALRAAGWSYEKIADEMGVSAQTIANRLKKDAIANRLKKDAIKQEGE